MSQQIVKRNLKKAKESIAAKDYAVAKDACLSVLDYDSESYIA